MSDHVRPFASADHFIAWQNANCCRCSLYDPDTSGPAECHLQNAVETCVLDEDAGRMAMHLAGTRSDGRISDRCPLLQLTEDARRDNSYRATLPLFGARER